MNERPPKLNPPLVELIPIPPPGTVTGVSSGAAALVPIEWLREINTKGVRPGELAVLLDELEDQAEEDMGFGVAGRYGAPQRNQDNPRQSVPRTSDQGCAPSFRPFYRHRRLGLDSIW